jgi:hypothetical protein
VYVKNLAIDIVGLRPESKKKEAICYQYFALTGQLKLQA